mmetsp:Transcript_76036/g.163206  ORF Transcript_76036/g.163206 Transcript_76036/m.163206 type:complete len:217 (-) Transcript_76036:34-684(-)
MGCSWSRWVAGALAAKRAPEGVLVKISATKLSGETIAEIDISSGCRISDLEQKICEKGDIDQKQFALKLLHKQSILPRSQRIGDVVDIKEDVLLVTVIKEEKPRGSPQLDQALFMEAWRGGGYVDKVQALLDKRADPNGYTYADGDRAIHVAAGRGYTDVVRVLLDAAAEIDMPGVRGMTPMQRCSHRPTDYWRGWHPEVQALLRARADELQKSKF